MKIIFITRKYPPLIGGMEKLSYEITTRVSEKNETEIIALKKSQFFLPLFFIYAIIKGIQESKKEKCVVHVGDGALSPIGPIIKFMTGNPIILTLHGLDITYPNYFYQKIMPFFMKRYNKIICISNKVIEECEKRGIPKNKCMFIPIGIQKKPKIEYNKNRLKEKLKIDLEEKEILLSVGRLVERKGFHWFLSEVFPLILRKRDNLVYLIAGKGTMEKEIKRIIKEKNLEKNVFLLGEIENEFLEKVFACSDIFVMPNTRVKGDMEGFGIVAIEAASYGLPVIASNLEGIRDAIKNGKNGILVEEENKEEYLKKLLDLLKNKEKRQELGEKAKLYTENNLEWNKIIEKYAEVYESVKKN